MFCALEVSRLRATSIKYILPYLLPSQKSMSNQVKIKFLVILHIKKLLVRGHTC